MLKIRNLKKAYGNLHALEGLDMDVTDGALFGFVGPNGAGKTTTIRIMTGLLAPDSGSVEFDGQDAYSEDLGVPFVHYETFFDPSTDTRKSPCFLCSWNRRKALFTVAKEQGCNKIALGHHMDDILETLLMNITFQGAFSTMPPKLVMRKFEMTIIRPMCLVHEADLIEMARIRGFRKQIKDCPYESLSNRSNMKEVLYSLEKMNPEARYSLWKCMTNIQEELLPGMNEHDL